MKPSRAPQMFVTALRMHHWRNFRGPVDVRLRRRAFLIGPNASRKSNVLDALRFLRDTAGHGLKEAVRTRGGSPLTGSRRRHRDTGRFRLAPDAWLSPRAARAAGATAR